MGEEFKIGQFVVVGDPDGIALLKAFREIGPNARGLLQLLADRLVLGKERGHGDFTDKRDWAQEALEENLDAAIYQAAHTMQQRDAKISFGGVGNVDFAQLERSVLQWWAQQQWGAQQRSNPITSGALSWRAEPPKPVAGEWVSGIGVLHAEHDEAGRRSGALVDVDGGRASLRLANGFSWVAHTSTLRREAPRGEWRSTGVGPDGAAGRLYWPAVGETVRVEWRLYPEAAPFVGDTITWTAGTQAELWTDPHGSGGASALGCYGGAFPRGRILRVVPL